MQASNPSQYVTEKLRHKGEGFAPPSETSYIKQQEKDRLDQGPNMGPVVETVSLPDDLNSQDDIKDNHLYDVFESIGEPTQEKDNPGNMGHDPVSEKLQLKKDAAAVMAKYAELTVQGERIIEYLTRYAVQGQKYASAAAYYDQSNISADQLVKAAMLDVVDESLYAAEAVALKLASDASEADAEEAAALAGGGEGVEADPAALEAMDAAYAGEDAAGGYAGEDGGGELTEDDLVALATSLLESGVSPEETEEVISGVVDELIGGGDEGAGLEGLGEELPADAGGGLPEEAAFDDTKTSEYEDLQPMPDAGAEGLGGEGMEALPADAGAGQISEDEIVGIVQELSDAGYSPDEIEAVLEQELGADADDAEISPDEEAAIVQELSDAGVTEEELAEVLQELEAEQAAGVDPSAASAIDEEVSKTGSYKYASFIGRQYAKTADEEQRGAVLRMYLRDVVYGPRTRNFN
jgi:hypothetical protein